MILKNNNNDNKKVDRLAIKSTGRLYFSSNSKPQFEYSVFQLFGILKYKIDRKQVDRQIHYKSKYEHNYVLLVPQMNIINTETSRFQNGNHLWYCSKQKALVIPLFENTFILSKKSLKQLFDFQICIIFCFICRFTFSFTQL